MEMILYIQNSQQAQNEPRVTSTAHTTIQTCPSLLCFAPTNKQFPQSAYHIWGASAAAASESKTAKKKTGAFKYDARIRSAFTKAQRGRCNNGKNLACTYSSPNSIDAFHLYLKEGPCYYSRALANYLVHRCCARLHRICLFVHWFSQLQVMFWHCGCGFHSGMMIGKDDVCAYGRLCAVVDG